jgi:flagellar hook-basal body complex protein FliE
MAANIGPANRIVPDLIEKVNPGRSQSDGNIEASRENFSNLLSKAIDSVNDLQLEAAEAQKALLAGEPVELHEVMIKAEEAGLATELLLEVRNRLVTAYEELMRMPV